VCSGGEWVGCNTPKLKLAGKRHRPREGKVLLSTWEALLSLRGVPNCPRCDWQAHKSMPRGRSRRVKGGPALGEGGGVSVPPLCAVCVFGALSNCRRSCVSHN
jgi:hypothetical protein